MACLWIMGGKSIWRKPMQICGHGENMQNSVQKVPGLLRPSWCEACCEHYHHNAALVHYVHTLQIPNKRETPEFSDWSSKGLQQNIQTKYGSLGVVFVLILLCELYWMSYFCVIFCAAGFPVMTKPNESGFVRFSKLQWPNMHVLLQKCVLNKNMTNPSTCMQTSI